MKNLTFLSCLLALLIFNIPITANAQSYLSQYSGARRFIKATNVLDSAKLKITYSLSYVWDTSKPNEIFKDHKILLIGDNISNFYSYYVNQSDSALTADLKNNKASAAIKRPPDILGEAYNIYTNYPTGKRAVIESITGESIYKYEEPIEMPQWTVIGESEMILGYSCIKATTRFRGRDYEAWFTMSIPVNLGPWKLGGLPGLILRAYDTNKHYVFECVGIEQLKTKVPIEIPQWKCIEVTREDYVKTQKQYHNDFVNSLLAKGINVILLDDNDKRVDFLRTPNKFFEERGGMVGKRIYMRDRYKKVPYNPIELE